MFSHAARLYPPGVAVRRDTIDFAEELMPEKDLPNPRCTLLAAGFVSRLTLLLQSQVVGGTLAPGRTGLPAYRACPNVRPMLATALYAHLQVRLDFDQNRAEDVLSELEKKASVRIHAEDGSIRLEVRRVVENLSV